MSTAPTGPIQCIIGLLHSCALLLHPRSPEKVQPAAAGKHVGKKDTTPTAMPLHHRNPKTRSPVPSTHAPTPHATPHTLPTWWSSAAKPSSTCSTCAGPSPAAPHTEPSCCASSRSCGWNSRGAKGPSSSPSGAAAAGGLADKGSWVSVSVLVCSPEVRLVAASVTAESEPLVQGFAAWGAGAGDAGASALEKPAVVRGHRAEK